MTKVFLFDCEHRDYCNFQHNDDAQRSAFHRAEHVLCSPSLEEEASERDWFDAGWSARAAEIATLRAENERLRQDCVSLRTILFAPRKVRDLPRDVRDIIMEQAAKVVAETPPRFFDGEGVETRCNGEPGRPGMGYYDDRPSEQQWVHGLCPGCPTCRSCETCGGRGWSTEPEHDIDCDPMNGCGAGCPVPVQVPCPQCSKERSDGD